MRAGRTYVLWAPLLADPGGTVVMLSALLQASFSEASEEETTGAPLHLQRVECVDTVQLRRQQRHHPSRAGIITVAWSLDLNGWLPAGLGQVWRRVQHRDDTLPRISLGVGCVGEREQPRAVLELHSLRLVLQQQAQPLASA